jgi:hypothetical protein
MSQVAREVAKIGAKIDFFAASEFNFAKNSLFLGRTCQVPIFAVGNPVLFGICLANK